MALSFSLLVFLILMLLLCVFVVVVVVVVLVPGTIPVNPFFSNPETSCNIN